MVVECRLNFGDSYKPEAPAPIKYLCSLYLAFTTITTVGYGDITMATTTELIYAIIMISLGATSAACPSSALPAALLMIASPASDRLTCL